MRLQDMLETVISSAPEDWHSTICDSESGPSYRYTPKFEESHAGNKRMFYAEGHSTVAVYIPDISITMAWGLRAGEDFEPTWTKHLHHLDVSPNYVDLFYNNAMVFREIYVTVDQHRAVLPLPNQKGQAGGVLEVPSNKYRFMRLLNSISSPGYQFHEYFHQVGFTEVKEPWPSWLKA